MGSFGSALVYITGLLKVLFCTLLYVFMIRENGELISSFSSDENGQERFLNQFRCRTHCPRGLYADRAHYACLPCISNCELCTDGNICAKCRDQYKLQNGICQLASCDMGKCEAYRLYMNVKAFDTDCVFQGRCRTLIQESALIVRWDAKRVPQVGYQEAMEPCGQQYSI